MAPEEPRGGDREVEIETGRARERQAERRVEGYCFCLGGNQRQTWDRWFHFQEQRLWTSGLCTERRGCIIRISNLIKAGAAVPDPSSLQVAMVTAVGGDRVMEEKGGEPAAAPVH